MLLCLIEKIIGTHFNETYICQERKAKTTKQITWNINCSEVAYFLFSEFNDETI